MQLKFWSHSREIYSVLSEYFITVTVGGPLSNKWEEEKVYFLKLMKHALDLCKKVGDLRGLRWKSLQFILTIHLQFTPMHIASQFSLSLSVLMFLLSFLLSVFQSTPKKRKKRKPMQGTNRCKPSYSQVSQGLSKHNTKNGGTWKWRNMKKTKNIKIKPSNFGHVNRWRG